MFTVCIGTGWRFFDTKSFTTVLNNFPMFQFFYKIRTAFRYTNLSSLHLIINLIKILLCYYCACYVVQTMRTFSTGVFNKISVERFFVINLPVIYFVVSGHRRYYYRWIFTFCWPEWRLIQNISPRSTHKTTPKQSRIVYSLQNFNPNVFG